MSGIETGLYQHYKGAEYEVLGLVTHSETEEKLVVYRALYGEFGLWVRPLDMFKESVSINGLEQDRFKLINAYNVELGKHLPSTL